MNQAEKSLLTDLIRSQTWEIVSKIAAELIMKYQEAPINGMTEFETIKRAITRDAKVEAFKELIDTIEKESL